MTFGPVVHQLTDVGIRPVVERFYGEGAAGDRPADGCGAGLGEFWW